MIINIQSGAPSAMLEPVVRCNHCCRNCLRVEVHLRVVMLRRIGCAGVGCIDRGESRRMKVTVGIADRRDHPFPKVLGSGHSQPLGLLGIRCGAVGRTGHVEVVLDETRRTDYVDAGCTGLVGALGGCMYFGGSVRSWLVCEIVAHCTGLWV